MTPRKNESREEFIERRRDYRKNYHIRNRDKINEKSKAWRIANPVRARANRRQNYLHNLNRDRTYNRNWAKANPGKILASVKKWQKANPGRVRQIYKNWVAKNTEKRRVTKKQSNHKRKAILRRTSFEDCRDKLSILGRERFCRWCCTALSNFNRAIDHIIPLSRGGQHISDNLAASCRKCNCSRGNKFVSEWLPFQKFI